MADETTPLEGEQIVGLDDQLPSEGMGEGDPMLEPGSGLEQSVDVPDMNLGDLPQPEVGAEELTGAGMLDSTTEEVELGGDLELDDSLQEPSGLPPLGDEPKMEMPSASDNSNMGMTDSIQNNAGGILGNGVLDMNTIRNIKVSVQAVLGGISMSVSKLSDLKEGEVISLEKNIGDEIEIHANGQLIAHGEIVVIEGAVPKFGITITSIVGT